MVSLYDADELVGYLEGLVDRYPIWSIEDRVGEDDEKRRRLLTQRLGDRVQLVGNDNLVTDPATVAGAIDNSVGNAALLKVNQVGIVTETLDATRRCREAGWGAIFFRVGVDDQLGLGVRLRAHDAFDERHLGEFYEMTSEHDPDRTALGFWAPLPGAQKTSPSFVPPSV